MFEVKNARASRIWVKPGMTPEKDADIRSRLLTFQGARK